MSAALNARKALASLREIGPGTAYAAAAETIAGAAANLEPAVELLELLELHPEKWPAAAIRTQISLLAGTIERLRFDADQIGTTPHRQVDVGALWRVASGIRVLHDVSRALRDSGWMEPPRDRKPVAVAAETDTETPLLACDDGSVYRLTYHHGYDWTPVAPVPGSLADRLEREAAERQELLP